MITTDVRSPLVRNAVQADFEQWLPLWDGYNAFYGRHGASALPMEITQLTWSRFFDPAEPVSVLVAEREGTLVAFTHYLFHRSTIHVNPTCYLQDLYTDEAFRSQGIARALILAVYDQARLAGTKRVYWHTQETNLVAMELYNKVAERSGFIVYRKDL
jgi:GNAT superfamily N-acetyltransferase